MRVRSYVRLTWLRLMKRLVALASGMGSLSELMLRILTKFPSRWTALVALSRSVQASNPQLAVRFAELAVEDHRGVAPPYERLFAAWKEVDPHHGLALVSVLAILPKNLRPRLEAKWNVSTHPAGDLASFVPLTNEEVAEAADRVLRLGGQLTQRGIGLLVGAYGIGWLDDASDALSYLDETKAIKIFQVMRSEGEVARPISFLSSLPASPAIEMALKGAEQDLSAMNQEIDLKFRKGMRYESKRGTSLYLLHNSLPDKSGGYSTRSHGIATGLRAHGVEAIPVTRPGFPPVKYVFDQDPAAPNVHVVDGIPYHRLKGKVTSQPRSDLQGFVDLYGDMLQPLVAGYRPSVIHAASNWWNGFAGVALAKRHGLPSVYEIRGLWELTRASNQGGWNDSERYRADANYETSAAMLADRVIVITEGLQGEMAARGIPIDKMSVVPNAVNLNEFRPVERDSQLERQLGLDGSCVIGFAGSLTFYEGLDDLLRAGALLRGRTSTPFRFLIVGDGAVMGSLKDLAQELQMEDICSFTGRVPHAEVPRYLSLMDITPFPRIPIPVCEMVSPLKPLESMAMRVTVLASDVKALQEMVPPGTGLTFKKGELASLSERLQLLIEDPELRKQLADNAYDWVAERRSWKAVSLRIKEVYEELTG